MLAISTAWTYNHDNFVEPQELRNRNFHYKKQVNIMSDIVTSDHFGIECRIAARDTEARTVADAAAADRESKVALGTLERLIAEADDRRDRIERVKRYMAVLLEWMATRDWPGFHAQDVLVGTKDRPVWKGLLGHRVVPVIERRATLTRLGAGITARGEFVEVCRARDLIDTLVDPDSQKFDLFGFESFFWAFFDYYGIDPDA